MPEYWPSSAQDAPHYPSLSEDLAVEVAVVGAGIVGLTTAELLSREGRRVAVLEGRRVGRQATGNSTAKVTSQHGLVYGRLAEALDEEAARAYGAANEAAIRRIAGLVQELGIDCDFERKAAYVYAAEEQEVAALQAEAETAARCGLPASFTRDLQLPFPVAGALRFEEQAQFHPVRYLDGLAASVAGKGRLFEATRATEIEEGRPCRVHTDTGATVTADHVVVATQMPIIAGGLFFAKAYPFAHAMTAARIDPARAPDGLFISAGEPRHSFRVHSRDGDTWLVAVGGTFKPGHPEEQSQAFAELDAFLRGSFGIEGAEYRWTNEDFKPMDGLPFVGPASGGSPHLLVATGFNAWGITTGTAAAEQLCALVQGREDPWGGLFDATRLKPVTGAREFVKENLQAGKHLLEGRLLKSRPDQVALAPGEGAVVEHDGKQLALSRDAQGRLHAVSAVCTHLGCIVGWNAIDGSWDCPCHGSRFLPDGSVLRGPATAPLERKPADSAGKA